MRRVSSSRSSLRPLAAAGLGAFAIFSTWASACAPRPPGTGSGGDAPGLSGTSAALGGVAASATPPPPRATDLGTAPAAEPIDRILPPEALDLLTQSTRDSCAICAERNRERAFALLDQTCVPGRLVIADGEVLRFLQVEGGENEVFLSSLDRAEPTVTFRFHTAANHLVGVAESAWTDPTVAEVWASLPPGSGGPGSLEIVAYAYGDGPSYLYFPGRNHLQVQCRILDLSE